MLRLIWSILLDHLPRRESDRVGGQSGIKQSGDRPTFVRYSAFRGPPPSLLALCGGLRGRNLIVMGGMLSEIRKGDKKKVEGNNLDGACLSARMQNVGLTMHYGWGLQLRKHANGFKANTH